MGWLLERHPSSHPRYQIDHIEEEKKRNATGIKWSKIALKEGIKEESLGRYFLRTNMELKEDCYIWHV